MTAFPIEFKAKVRGGAFKIYSEKVNLKVLSSAPISCDRKSNSVFHELTQSRDHLERCYCNKQFLIDTLVMEM